MLRNNSAEKLDTIFVLMVFCIFAASVLMVLMLGGSVYQNTNEIINEHYDERTALSYIWSRVKNADEAGLIYVDDFEGITTLFLEEAYDGYSFETLIYLYEGWINELYCEVGYAFGPEFGTQILKAERLDFEALENGLIKATTSAGSIVISPRSRMAVGY